MKSYVIHLFHRLIADICELSKVSFDAPDDITYEWVSIEGPKLDKALLHWIEVGGEFPPFPEWISPLSDAFRSSLDPKVLKFLRQCLLFCYKIEIEPTNEQLKEAQASFENTDADIEAWDTYFKYSSQAPVFTSARQIIGRVIGRIDWRTIYPKHGPGAVFPSRAPSAKGRFDTIYSTLEPFYGFADYLCTLPNYWSECMMHWQPVLRESEQIVARLVAVPKDSRGPRLICVHPAEAIWIQQGCRKVLEDAIGHRRYGLGRSISFQDQSVNGDLALSSSRDQEYVTLDLKEASDRISCELVRFLFGDYAYSWMSCSRASHVRLLDNRVIALRKWAPMGNCLTFPVQSLIFYSLVRSGIRCRYGIDCRDVYVFGDDIIFPTKYYDGAVNALIRAGVIPNVSKTFRHGLFRESCGVDAYNGIDVTPHRLRKVEVVSVSGAMSICALAKALVLDGYHRTSDMLYRRVEERWGRLQMSNNPDAQGLYRFEQCSLETLLRYEDSTRFNRDLHRWETRLRLVVGASESGHSDAWWHLQESILRLHHMGDTDSTRGLEYTVPHRARLQRGWIGALMGTSSLAHPDPVMGTDDQEEGWPHIYAVASPC